MSPQQPAVPCWETNAFFIEVLACIGGGALAAVAVCFLLAEFSLRWTWVVFALAPTVAMAELGPWQAASALTTFTVMFMMFGVAGDLAALYEGGTRPRRAREKVGPLDLFRAWRARKDPFLIEPRRGFARVLAKARVDKAEWRPGR